MTSLFDLYYPFEDEKYELLKEVGLKFMLDDDKFLDYILSRLRVTQTPGQILEPMDDFLKFEELARTPEWIYCGVKINPKIKNNDKLLFSFLHRHPYIYYDKGFTI